MNYRRIALTLVLFAGANMALWATRNYTTCTLPGGLIVKFQDGTGAWCPNGGACTQDGFATLAAMC